MNLSELFDERLLFFNLEVLSRKELLEKVAMELEAKNFVKPSYKEALLARELKYPTGLPTEVIKVAIPHTDPEHVNRSVISITKLKNPVQFHEMGNHDQLVEVEIVFTLALNDSKNHLDVIQKLIGLFSNQEIMWKLKQASSKQELLDVVHQAIYVK